ncbi:hypothetical protein T11_7703 [Trichinella zimbabwensis]|uniref:Uncharacterized protein n=1 Tax=Trichinella zimbabwensis TaxID=268475 RepID=A0A0V1GPA9_9BILA|nr:hypothetical protein T11_7703 [Trichinella zimbabwensis]
MCKKDDLKIDQSMQKTYNKMSKEENENSTGIISVTNFYRLFFIATRCSDSAIFLAA